MIQGTQSWGGRFWWWTPGSLAVSTSLDSNAYGVQKQQAEAAGLGCRTTHSRALIEERGSFNCGL